MTPQSCVISSLRHPFGTTSIKNLNSFMTPPKPKSDKLVMYDIINRVGSIIEQ
jgi:hypothetical protein